MTSRHVVMGKVLGAHGVRGALRVQSFADPPEGLAEHRTWWLCLTGQPPRSVRVTHAQYGTRGLIAEIEGVADRDAAAALTGAEVAVERARLPRLPRGQYYWTDLEGLRVVNREGVDFGVVDHLFDNGAHPILVAKSAEHERLIPFVIDSYIVSVDLDGGLLTVDWDADF